MGREPARMTGHSGRAPGGAPLAPSGPAARARVRAGLAPACAAAAAAVSTAGHAAAGPVGRRAGQRLARRELSEASIPQRIFGALLRLFSDASHALGGGWAGVVALAVLSVLGVTVIAFWLRPALRRRAARGPVLAGPTRTAEGHRREAARLAAAGDHAAAIVEGVRAISVELGQRGILPPKPGRTAGELAAEAGRELPALASSLRVVARIFDDVRYGGREGTPAGYLAVTELDAAVRVTGRPARAPGPRTAATGPGTPL